MALSFIITGTDTGIGKTTFAAMLTLALKATYWKPLQSGLENIDTRTVQRLTGLADEHFLPERHIFTQALSPHRAAEMDGVEIDLTALGTPKIKGPLLIEGAGGLMVPITRDVLQIDLFKHWNLPVILCARTGLGTINHTLLSIEALRARAIAIHGIVFIGAANEDNVQTIADFSGARVLGHMPVLKEVNAKILQSLFDKNFKKEDY